MSFDNYNSAIFTVGFTGVTLPSSVASDILTYTGSTACRTIVEKFNFGQRSTAIAQNQQIEIDIYRGVTAVSSTGGGGATLPMYNTKGHATALSTGYGTLQGQSSAVALTSAAQLLNVDTSDYSGNYVYRPDDGEEIYLEAGQAMTIRGSAPGAAIVIGGTFVARQIPLKG